MSQHTLAAFLGSLFFRVVIVCTAIAGIVFLVLDLTSRPVSILPVTLDVMMLATCLLYALHRRTPRSSTLMFAVITLQIIAAILAR